MIMMNTTRDKIAGRRLRGAVQPMPVTNIIKIKLSFDHEPCRGKEYGIDVEKNTTIQELKNYIKKSTACRIPHNAKINLRLQNGVVLHDEQTMGVLLILEKQDNPLVFNHNTLVFNVDVTSTQEVPSGGRKSRAKPRRRNSKKNKRTRRKSLKKQHRRK